MYVKRRQRGHPETLRDYRKTEDTRVHNMCLCVVTIIYSIRVRYITLTRQHTVGSFRGV